MLSSLTCAHTKGRDVLLVFEEDVGAVPTKACQLDSDNDVVHLARAAQTVRHHMFEEGEPFNGFPEGHKEDYVPSLLLALVSMVLECPSIKDQMADLTPAALAIGQMLKFNCIKHTGAHPTTRLVTAKHNALYLGLSDSAFLTRLCSTDKHLLWYLVSWVTMSPALCRPSSSVSSRMTAQSRTLLST